MKNNKLLYILGTITVIVIIIAMIIGKKKKANSSVEVEMETVAKHDITQYVTASGKIYPQEEVKISSDVSGEIIELNVAEGQIVKKGQLLARIQAESYVAFVDQSTANLNSSKSTVANLQARLQQVEAQLLNAESAYNRSKGLYDKKIISKSDLENAEAAYQSAKAEYKAAQKSIDGANYNVKAAQAAIKDAKNNLNKTAIYAPMDGVISLLNVKKGEKVVGTLQMAGTEMMRIANFEAMEVKVEVSESEIIKIRQGDTALVEVDAYLDRKFKAIVTEIANTSKGASGISGLTSDQSTNFEVKVTLLKQSYIDLLTDNPKPFLPGMSATVDIITDKKPNTLAIPIQAVTTKDTMINGSMKTQELVFKVVDGIAKQQVVTSGIQNENYIQILEGLKQNDKVVTGPYNVLTKELKEGDKVSVKKEEEKK
ncbi:MAG: efflux RND transporter periplasmic adaptor subunit [Chitinophagales bacterium]|nr:efflux RND transporter periplasmic adaptor subunit [Chitinophagales bacterium]